MAAAALLRPASRTTSSGRLPAGAMLDDRYEVVRLLGTGGMGLVYAARQIATDREVAVKVLHEHLLHHPRMARRFQREAQLSFGMLHPNLIRVHDFGRSPEGLPYLVMELLEGGTLRRAIADGPLPPVQALTIALQICAGLEEAHRRTIVHRDLKPENVMLCPTPGHGDLVKILDFGIAQVLGEPEPLSEDAPPRLFDNEPEPGDSEEVVGSPPYMSPEQAMNGAVDERGDLYSLGVILHEMLMGKPPDLREPLVAITALLATKMPRPAADSLGQLIQRCLQVRPADRPRSAGVLGDALDRVLTGLSAKGLAKGRTTKQQQSWFVGTKRPALRECSAPEAPAAPGPSVRRTTPVR